MRVLYDISVLGVGHRSPNLRTGVYRVIENVAKQLITRPECEMIFCNNRDRETINESQAYLKDTQEFSSVRFSKPPFFDQQLKGLEKRNELINSSMVNLTMPALTRLQVKLKIKELSLREKFYKKYKNELIHPRDMKRADIYHSPFYDLPDNISKGRIKSVFLTCYDLIPILFPHFFERNLTELMHAIVGSMTQETWVLCISESTRTDLLNYLGSKVNPERVIVTELAASDIFYKSTDKEANLLTRQKYNIPQGPYVLSLCTFEPRKNIDQVIRSFVKMISQENIKDLHLVLVGNQGWLFEKIFSEIANSSFAKERIIITGFVADEDLAALYSDALMFVYPSFYEGFGLPPLEAMKCGTPVITSNTSSLPEVVGNAGIMVDPSDTDALCQSMLNVYNNTDLQKQMSSKSLARASLFSWERCGKETVDAYAASL